MTTPSRPPRMSVNGVLLSEEQTISILWSVKQRLRQLRKLRKEHDSPELRTEADRSITRLEELWPILIQGGAPPAGLEEP